MVKAARAAIELHLSSRSFNSKLIERYISDLDEDEAVFVSLQHYPTNTPRGSAGFSKASQPLHQAVVISAIAATEDMRYVPVSHLEFEHLVIEVSILSKFEGINGKSPAAIARGISIGVNGLRIEYGYHSATFLPQLPMANGWDARESLDELCIAAGLKDHMWKAGNARLFRFTTQRFRELTPRGPIEEILTEQ